MDWKTQSCIKADTDSNMLGCKISTDNGKCTLCHPEY